MVIFIILVLFISLLLGMPIFLAMGVASIPGLSFFTNVSLDVIATRIFGGIDRFGIMAMPFYIFAAYLMDVGGLSKRIMKWAFAVVGSIPSGLAVATELAAMVFGALSGSSPATVAAIGSITYPELLRHNYGKKFSLGLVTTCGSVSILIPPSITFIVYGSVTGTSVGSLFIAGILPGIVVGLGIMAYCFYYGLTHKVSSSTDAPSFKERLKIIWTSTKEAIWALLVPVIIVGGIYSGIFTPTEAAGVVVVYAMIAGVFIYKEIDLKGIFTATKKCAITLTQVMLLTALASLLSWVLTIGQGPQMMAEAMIQLTESRFVFLILTNLLLLFMGMFIEPTSITVITAPLLLPIAMQYGIDPVHFGIILTANVAIGMFTPPFGLNLFVTPSFSGEKVSIMISSVVPFLIISLITLLIVTYCPQISLYLPNLVFGR